MKAEILSFPYFFIHWIKYYLRFLFLVILLISPISVNPFSIRKLILINQVIANSEFLTSPKPWTAPDQKLKTYSNTSNPKMDTKVSLLIWNVQKKIQSLDLLKDLNQLSEKKELILLQETLNEKYFVQFLSHIHGRSHSIQMAASFYTMDLLLTGIMTASSSQPEWSMALASPVTEPILTTYKMSLISKYRLTNDTPLIVVNIHAINFTTNADFKTHLDSVISELKKWAAQKNTKFIFAGDFNSWNYYRMNYLITELSSLGFYHYVFGNDPRKIFLDHIFIKGCESYAGEIHSNITSSDHYPISLELLCE